MMNVVAGGVECSYFLSFWRETSQRPGTFILLEGNLPKPGNQLHTEELKYSRDRAWRHRHPTNNLLEVWQNFAIFGGRPIGAAVEAMLSIVVNPRLLVSLIVVFLLPPTLHVSVRVLGVFICTPKTTFVSPKHAVCANALLTLYIFTRLTQQSAQSFWPAPSGQFDI